MGLSNNTMFLVADGSIKAVGNNEYGQLGLGNKVNQSSIQNVPLTGVKQVASSQRHTVFLMIDGSVKSVGSNDYGQLGLGNKTEQSSIQNVSLTGVKQIACGAQHTMFLMLDGTVKACGYNAFGQLGIGNTADQSGIKDLSLIDVKQIECGENYTVFLMKDGKIKAVGDNTYGQLGKGDLVTATSIVDITISNVKKIACGLNHTMFLMQDGAVKSVGYAEHGQLAINSNPRYKEIIQDSLISGVKQIACGQYHTTFLMQDGTVKSVGNNDFGQLGNGNLVSSTQLQNTSLQNVLYIVCGLNHTMFLMQDGTVKGVGYNQYGQIGDATPKVSQSTVKDALISNIKLLNNLVKGEIKYLIQDGTSIKTYLNNAWATLGASPLVKSYLDQGMTSLSALTDATLGQLTATAPELLAWYEEDEGAKTLTMGGPIWEEVATILPTPEDMALKGMPEIKDIPASAWAALGGDFEVITHTNVLDETQKVFLEAMPKDQLVQGATDFTDVAQLALVASTGVKVIVSADSGVSWKTLTAGAFTTILPTVDVVKTSGMTVADFNLITADQWKAFGGKVRVAYLLSGDAILDKITVTKVQVTDATPSIDNLQVEYEEMTLEGRLKDLERLNAINLAKLNFKANALLLSDAYKLDDLVVDTFEKDTVQTKQSSVDETVDQAFSATTAMGDGYYSEVTINQTKTVKGIVVK